MHILTGQPLSAEVLKEPSVEMVLQEVCSVSMAFGNWSGTIWVFCCNIGQQIGFLLWWFYSIVIALLINYDDDTDSDRGDISNHGLCTNKLLHFCKSYHVGQSAFSGVAERNKKRND